MDDASVVLSLGNVEGWIEKVMAAKPDLINGDVALGHLKVIEEALIEQRRNLQTLRRIVAKMKELADAGSAL